MLPDNIESRDVYSVTRLNREVRAVLEGSFPAIWIQGEISNLARPVSGHLYFSLKDTASQVRCAMFKGRNRYLKFEPENGMDILARVSVSLYEGRGEFQLIIEHMEPAGEGALQKAFEELKQKLNREGLFDEAAKKPLPDFPRSIGIITSPTGAAIRDILSILKRRYPVAGVIIYPVQVQGEGSVESISGAIYLADQRKDTDVLILSRGGGSLEDLWSFNDERVARAIYQCNTPLISGVGHEIDFTIADFVADKRAPTPSAAAELAAPHSRDILDRLISTRGRLYTHIRYVLESGNKHLLQLEKRLPDPVRQLQIISQRIDDISTNMVHAMKAMVLGKHNAVMKLSVVLNEHNPLQKIRLNREKNHYLGQQLRRNMSDILSSGKQNLENQSHALHTVSPLATLDRGYAIVTHNDTILRDPADVKVGDEVRSRLVMGSLISKVTKIDKE